MLVRQSVSLTGLCGMRVGVEMCEGLVSRRTKASPFEHGCCHASIYTLPHMTPHPAHPASYDSRMFICPWIHHLRVIFN